MATEWFYFQDDRRLGPFTPQQMKDLAVQGTLIPESMIWKEGLEQPVPARKLKGLFGGTAGESAPSNPISTRSDEALPSTEPKPSGIENFLKKNRNEVWFLALTLVGCFPAGLYFVWTHPNYTKRKKWIITGCVTTFFFLVSLGDKSSIKQQGRVDSDQPEYVEVAVAGAERDRKKFMAAESFGGTSKRVDVLKKIVKQFKNKPDRMASVRDEQRFMDEKSKLIAEFEMIAFNGSYQSRDAKLMIEFWNNEAEGKYSGTFYERIKTEMDNIMIQYKNRVN